MGAARSTVKIIADLLLPVWWCILAVVVLCLSLWALGRRTIGKRRAVPQAEES